MVVLVAYTGLAVAVLGANPFRGTTVGPFDLLVAQPGWATTHGNDLSVRSFERTDVLDALLPRWMFARQELRAGRLPIWNPLPGGGEAGIQNLASAQLNPAFVLFAVARSPSSGFYAATLFNLVVAALGAHLWLRRRLSVAAASFGGVSVMFCGFNTAWLFWPHMLTSIWICWLLWAVDGWWREGGAARFAALTAATTLLILGGFPFVTELGLGAAVLQVIMLACLERKASWRGRLGGFLGALVLSFGICAVPLIAVGRWLANVDVTYRVGGSTLHLLPDASLLLPLGARHDPIVESTMYAGTLGLLLALVGVALALRRFRKPLVTLAFPLLLFVVGLVMTFELVPHGWLARVPGLGSNPWSRGIVLLDIGLAAMAACAVDAIVAAVPGRSVAVALATVLTGVQVADLASFFRVFNGPVASAYFYPSTPIIDRVRADAGPFDGAVADRNYLVSGTLGAYGIREWFGHGFKSRATKDALSSIADRPFTTPTASILTDGQLALSSPAMRALGIRYVLGDKALLSRTIVPIFSPGSAKPMVALPSLATAHWTQRITLADTFRVTAIALRLATYGASGLHGSVELTLRSTDGVDLRLGTSRIAAGVIVDGAMTPFPFAPGISLPPGDYDMSLAYEGGAPGEAITAWYTPGHGENCTLRTERTAHDGCLITEWLSERNDVGGWRQITAVGELLLLENPETPRGPYFIKTLSEFPDASSTASVRTTPSRAHGWILVYEGHEPGFVVIPMSSNRAWHFLRDGKPVEPVRYVDALPAIAVDGRARIEVRYEPMSLRWGRWISGGSLLTALVVIVAMARRGRAIAGRR